MTEENKQLTSGNVTVRHECEIVGERHSSVNGTDDDDEDDDRRHSGVKSTAIVKYASTEMPARYHELQPNTNLNTPPSNWLYGNSKWESYIQNVSLGQEHSFSSFRMAHGCLELTGEVDVVSDSENIKKLLKMPFSSAGVSLMVHRVGNTLMLDDFDVHRHLLRQQHDDWKWLRKFFHETVLNDASEAQRDTWIARKNKSRDHLQNRNMFSKFLYYSMNDGPSNDCSSVNSVDSLESSHNKPAPKTSPKVHRLSKRDGLDHQRTVLWTFEDSRMLIGTDLPIFGGGTRPCVSLKLRDMKKPISVLTGLDYWLDNLMCNVPELAMCYHDSGIVQSYELIKTEDIPNMNDSRFSPTVVKDVAQNILSFLKSNATKEGHTYWLFKGHNDDVVKLYDLTTLCAHLMNDQNANPFTVPVGILLYRVARNMWIGKKSSCRKKINVIHKLLTNCLKLLDAYQYSQLVTSAHYLLTDLYVSDNIENDTNASKNGSEDSRSPKEAGEESEDDEEEEDDIVDKGVDGGDGGGGLQKNRTNPADPPSSVDVMALCIHKKIKTELVGDFASRYPNVPSDTSRCCKRAIGHIAQGLKVLKDSISNDSLHKNIVEEQAQCDPNTAIPLFYHPLKSDLSLAVFSRNSPGSDGGGIARQSTDVNVEDDILPCSRVGSASDAWQSSSRVLLLRKAALVFSHQAKAEVDAKHFESGLGLIVKSLRCFSAVKKHLKGKAERSQMVLGSILCLLGDVFLALGTCGECQKIKKTVEAEAESDEEALILATAEEDIDDFEYQWAFEDCNDPEICLNRSVRSYQLAYDCHAKVSSGSQRNCVVKRIGNAHNALALFYMNLAVTILNSGKVVTLTEMQVYTGKSRQNYESALISFKSLGDTLNVILVGTNFAKLQRLNAHMIRENPENPDAPQQEFTQLERQFYTEAMMKYREALKLLGSRDVQPQLYDNILWDLSSMSFNMASLLQDHPPVSSIAQQKIEEEITRLMLESLECCKLLRTSDSKHEPSSDYRSGLILHRLAALYHNAFRNEADSQMKRRHRLDAEKYYRESFHLFRSLDSSAELLRLQLERVTLYDYQLSNQTSELTRLKTLQESLCLILDCIPALGNLLSQLVDTRSNESCDSSSLEEEAMKLVQTMQLRLQSILQMLTKCASAISKKGSKVELSLEICKSMYAKSLQHFSAKPLSKSEGGTDIITQMIRVLEEISGLYKSRHS